MRLLTTLLLLSFLAAPVHAALLWEQLPIAGQTSHVDQEFPDFPGYSTFQVHDVAVGSGGWVINSVTGFFTPSYWPATMPARLNIFSKTGVLPLPGDDPTLGLNLAAAIDLSDPTVMLVTVSGLNIALAPGAYWIGLTPIAGFQVVGQTFHLKSAPAIGDYSAIRNPGGSFGFGTGWTNYSALSNPPADGAIRIEGREIPGSAVPEPGTLALLATGLAGGLAFFRRRR